MAKNPFTKDALSQNKPRPSLIEPEYTESMSTVLAEGAKKYSVNNWKKCRDPKLYIDALERHLIAFKKGETHDKDGLDHLACIGCNAMFLQYMRNKNGKSK